MKDPPLPLMPLVLAKLLKSYPEPLRIQLVMIIRFGAEIGYKNPCDVHILSKNFASAIDDPSIINKKLEEDLWLRRFVHIHIPSISFILSPLGLVLKYDGGFSHIYHLSHPKGKSVTFYVSDRVGKPRYTRFQEVLDLILDANPSSSR